MRALAAILENGAPCLVKALLHHVQIASLEDGALCLENKMKSANCASKGHTTATPACPLQLHVYCAVQAGIAQVRVPTRVTPAASVQVANGQQSKEHTTIMIALAVPLAHGAPHWLRQPVKCACTVTLESGVLMLAAVPPMLAFRVPKVSGVMPLEPLQMKNALTVLPADGATLRPLHYRAHVENACRAHGAQLLEQTQKTFACHAVEV